MSEQVIVAEVALTTRYLPCLFRLHYVVDEYGAIVSIFSESPNVLSARVEQRDDASTLPRD